MIEVRGLTARLGTFQIRDVSFVVPQGGYGVVIGAAGSGKTTLLECIAGIVRSTSGSVLLGGRDVSRARPEDRRLGLVYQHGYLFPHLTARENIHYGTADTVAVDEIIARFGIEPLLSRDVRELSGGERQVVAIARALAPRPPVLLLDEPFSALDPRRRSSLRRELRNLFRLWGTSVLQVTHDFEEAGLLGDVAILLDGGRMLQSGVPTEVFRRPASPYIAEFLGAENVYSGEIHEVAAAPTGPDSSPGSGSMQPDSAHSVVTEKEEVVRASTTQRPVEFTSGELRIHTLSDLPVGAAHAIIRAEEVVVATESNTSSIRNVFRGTIVERGTVGATTRVTVDIGGVPLVATLTTRSADDLELREGRVVWASFKAMAVHLC